MALSRLKEENKGAVPAGGRRGKEIPQKTAQVNEVAPVVEPPPVLNVPPGISERSDVEEHPISLDAWPSLAQYHDYKSKVDEWANVATEREGTPEGKEAVISAAGILTRRARAEGPLGRDQFEKLFRMAKQESMMKRARVGAGGAMPQAVAPVPPKEQKSPRSLAEQLAGITAPVAPSTVGEEQIRDVSAASVGPQDQSGESAISAPEVHPHAVSEPPPAIEEVMVLVGDSKQMTEPVKSEVVPQKEIIAISPELLASINALDERKKAIAKLEEQNKVARDPAVGKEIRNLYHEILKDEQQFFASPEQKALLEYANPNDDEVLHQYASWRRTLKDKGPAEAGEMSPEEKQRTREAQLRRALFVSKLQEQGVARDAAFELYQESTRRGKNIARVIEQFEQAKTEGDKREIFKRRWVQEALEWHGIRRGDKNVNVLQELKAAQEHFLVLPSAPEPKEQKVAMAAKSDSYKHKTPDVSEKATPEAVRALRDAGVTIPEGDDLTAFDAQKLLNKALSRRWEADIARLEKEARKDGGKMVTPSAAANPSAFSQTPAERAAAVAKEEAVVVSPGIYADSAVAGLEAFGQAPQVEAGHGFPEVPPKTAEFFAESTTLPALTAEPLVEGTVEGVEKPRKNLFADFNKSSATDVEFRMVGDTDPQGNTVGARDEGKEGKAELLSSRVSGEFEKRFNISQEELGKIGGFGELSEGQQLLVLERMKSVAFDDINKEKVSRYRARIDELSKSDRFWDKLKGMGMRATKQFQLGRMKDEVSAEWLKGNDVDASAMKKDALEGLVAQALQTKEFGVVEDEGKLYTAFISPKDFGGNIDEPTETKIFELNRIANLYANKGFAEEDETGKAELKAQYESAAREMTHLLADQTEGKWSGDKAAAWRTKLEGAVQMSRFFQDNPEVDKELSTAGKNIGSAVGFKNLLVERGAYSLLSGGARYLGVATLGLVAAPVVAAIGGGVMGWHRAKQELSENDLLAAMGEKDKSDDKSHEEKKKSQESYRKEYDALVKELGEVQGDEGKREAIRGKLDVLFSKNAINTKDRGSNVVEGGVLVTKLETVLKEYETASETEMAEVPARDVNGRHFQDISVDEGKHIVMEQVSKKESLRRTLEARVAYTTRKMEEELVDLGSARGDRMERMSALALALGKAQAELGFADEGMNALQTRLNNMLDLREEKIEANRKSHLIKQAAKGAAMGAGFSAAGMLVGSLLPGHARAGALHDALSGKQKPASLDNAVLQHPSGAKGLQEYLHAGSAAERAEIAKGMGMSVEEADARAAALLSGNAVSEGAPEVDVATEGRSTDIDDVVARRVLDAMDKALKPVGGGEEALAEAHSKALLYEAYIANPTKHAEIANMLDLTEQEVEAQIQGVLGKTPGGSAFGESPIALHTVASGENLTRILLEKSPAVHTINELAGRHEAERTIQNILQHLKGLPPEELQKIIPSGNVDLIRPGEQINIDLLEAKIGKVVPVDVSEFGTAQGSGVEDSALESVPDNAASREVEVVEAAVANESTSVRSNSLLAMETLDPRYEGSKSVLNEVADSLFRKTEAGKWTSGSESETWTALRGMRLDYMHTRNVAPSTFLLVSVKESVVDPVSGGTIESAKEVLVRGQDILNLRALIARIEQATNIRFTPNESTQNYLGRVIAAKGVADPELRKVLFG